jgi:probable HAF family extracellular repeat protein
MGMTAMQMSTTEKRSINFVIAAGALLALSVSAAGAQTYRITDLGVLAGESASYAIFLNSSAQVTGCSDTSNTQNNYCSGGFTGDAFLWTSSRMQSLGTLSGDDYSVGAYVNDSSVVVGFSGDVQYGTAHAFLWSEGLGMIPLEPLKGGDGYSIADAMNAAGVIVGESAVTNGDVHGVLWTGSGSNYKIHDIGTLPTAPYTYPYAINKTQQVVGQAYFNESGTKYHGFRWSKKAGWRNLGTLPGGQNSIADWINDAGVIVGASNSTKHPDGVAVYWDSSGKIHTIGTLLGGTTSYAGYISDSGVVVGESTISSGDVHAFIWTNKTGLRDLNKMIPRTSGWDLNHASAMNKSGQIVGFGTINGVTHGFLLTP